MTAFFGKTCRCGRSESVECPTMADIPAAQEGFVGWGYVNDRPRCPECLAAGETIVRVPDPNGARQHELFGDAA